MEAINRFNELFLDVWNDGVFGLNASEIIIGIIIFLFFYVTLLVILSKVLQLIVL